MKEVSEALDAFSLELFSLQGGYAEKTIETAFENNITVYDASYVLLAIMKNTYLHTADEKPIGRLKRKHLKHVRSIKDVQ